MTHCVQTSKPYQNLMYYCTYFHWFSELPSVGYITILSLNFIFSKYPQNSVRRTRTIIITVIRDVWCYTCNRTSLLSLCLCLLFMLIFGTCFCWIFCITISLILLFMKLLFNFYHQPNIFLSKEDFSNYMYWVYSWIIKLFVFKLHKFHSPA